jgi:hypothetical protein
MSLDFGLELFWVFSPADLPVTLCKKQMFAKLLVVFHILKLKVLVLALEATHHS